MTNTPPRASLVLYKNAPARVKNLDDKVEIELTDGSSLRVRPKDIILLHPGPIENLSKLEPRTGEVEAAWELLDGATTSLEDLAELIYGAYTPATAWAAWQQVAEGIYFHGEPEAVIARSVEEVASRRAAREAQAAEEQAWEDFLGRIQSGRWAPEDARFLRELEDQAFGRKSKSRVLQALGRPQSPENAHALLLKLGYWDALVNPHPPRTGVALNPSRLSLPELAEEPRVDLTHLPAFAIDDEGNRDPDDALSLEGDRLWVHVADAAALTMADSAADLEARARGATLYLPEKIVPMLPPEAVERLGLGLAEISPALSFGLDLGPGAEVAEVTLLPSWVRVQRLTYEVVETRLDEEPFRSLQRWSELYRARRAAKGAVMIELPEVRIELTDGRVRIRPLQRLRSRALVTEAMLMAGEAAARFALRNQIPFPFTTQEAPEKTDVSEGLAGMRALRRSLKPRQQKSVPGAHGGLGLEVYSQVTSPLRRYLDLVVHQQLRAYLRGGDLLDAQAMVERVGAAEAVSGNVRQAERLARNHWTMVYLMQNPDWRGEGVVVEKRGQRGVVLIPELALETGLRLSGDPPLNSTVPLRVNGINLPELTIHFQVER